MEKPQKEKHALLCLCFFKVGVSDKKSSPGTAALKQRFSHFPAFPFSSLKTAELTVKNKFKYTLWYRLSQQPQFGVHLIFASLRKWSSHISV